MACDFTTVHTLFFKPIYILVFMELKTRKIVHTAVTTNPTDDWTAQQLKEATPWDNRPKYLIRDNDSKYGKRFSAVAAATHIKELKTPFQAPKANDYASCCTSMERFGMTSRGRGRELSLHPSCLVGTASPIGSSYRYSGFSE